MDYDSHQAAVLTVKSKDPGEKVRTGEMVVASSYDGCALLNERRRFVQGHLYRQCRCEIACNTIGQAD